MIEVAASLAANWFIGGSAVAIIIAVIVTTINERNMHD